MIRHWLKPQFHNGFILFAAMGAFGALLAWISLGLINQAMQNIHFLQQYGNLAIMEGGLTQLSWIIAQGVVALASYLGFKSCETELVHRWRKA